MAVNWNRKSYTEEAFRKAWAEASSINDVARRLGLKVSGGSSTTLGKLGEELGLSTDHFMRTTRRPYTLEEILVENTPLAHNSGLRGRLVEAGLKENKCEHCGITEWLGQPAPLALDHIDGNNRNNCIENLRILCQNCHALTPTWCGKNKIRKAGNGLMPGANDNLCHCGKKTSYGAKNCRVHTVRPEKATYPPTEDILAGVTELGYLPYAKTIGLSGGVAVKKLLRRRGVTELPAGKNRVNLAATRR